MAHEFIHCGVVSSEGGPIVIIDGTQTSHWPGLDIFLSLHPICHFPPGTSKWNKIEHRMFSYITLNWRGRPLTSLEVIVSLIGSTTTRTGLRVDAALDTRAYPTRVVVSAAELSEVNLERHAFHGEWNYTIRPAKGELIS